MYYQFPKDPKKIKARIRSYERKLREEFEEGQYMGGDGYGKRYIVSALYLLIGDIEGAVKSFEWFVNNFPEDIGELFQYLCWAYAFYKTDDLKDSAKNILIETIFENIYLIPHLLGELKLTPDILNYVDIEDDEWVDKEYVYHLPEEYKDLWFNDKNALEWLKKIYYDDRLQSALKEYAKGKKNLDMSDASELKEKLVKKLKLEIKE